MGSGLVKEFPTRRRTIRDGRYGTDGYGTDGYGTDGYGTDGYGTDGYGTDGYGTDEDVVEPPVVHDGKGKHRQRLESTGRGGVRQRS